MARPTKQEQQQIEQDCYRLWVEGKSHTEIAAEANVAPNTVTKYVRKFLAAQPIASMSKEEREAAVWQEWAETRTGCEAIWKRSANMAAPRSLHHAPTERRPLRSR